jgi:hypothetical protein
MGFWLRFVFSKAETRYDLCCRRLMDLLAKPTVQSIGVVQRAIVLNY